MLIRHLRARRADVAWLAFWSLVQALPVLASGWSLAEATTGFLAGHVAVGLSWLGLLAVASAAGAFGVRQTYLRIGAIVEPLRDDLVTAVVAGALARSTASLAGPDTKSVARLTHQAEIVRDSLAGLLLVTSSFVFTIASAVAGLLTLVPAMLPYVLVPLLTAGLLLRLLLRPTVARQRAAVLAEEDVAEDTSRAVSGRRDVTACGAEERVGDELSVMISRQAAAARSVAAMGSARMLCLAVGGWLPLVLLVASAPALLGHGVSPGAIVGALTYISGGIRGALYAATQGMGMGLVRLYVTLERIKQTAAEQPAAAIPLPRRPRARHARPIPSPAIGPASGGAGARGDGGREPLHAREDRPPAIELRDVRFSYGPHAAPVIDGLSLRVPPGDHLAIAGPSGIGKSSLAGLIAGMLRPSGGEILIDGVPAADSGNRWRVLIPQEAYVFEGTLEENLTYYAPAADETALDKAAGEIGLAPLVTRLGGYGAEVTPAALSAGERQLIALTRAYLSPAPVAILDEATCYLDPAAERQAEEAFARRDGTLIVIAHRITSARRAKRILVLDGVTAQAGDHQALLAASPMYRDLAGYWEALAPAAD